MLLTGSSGLIGRALALRWKALGGEVIELAHQPRGDALTWHPEQGELPGKALENIGVVVHLAGETIGQRWSATSKKAIHDSRIFSTKLLAEKIAALRRPPPARRLLFAPRRLVFTAMSARRSWTNQPPRAGDF